MELVKFFILPLFLFLFFPWLKLTFFAPPLIIAIYQKRLLHTLWIAFGVGLFLDLAGPDRTIGLYTFNTVATTALISMQKNHFFEESLSTLPILTCCFAVVTTLLQFSLLLVFETAPPLSLGWVGTDLIAYPLLDSLYSFLGFTLPWFLWKQYKKRPIPEEEIE